MSVSAGLVGRRSVSIPDDHFGLELDSAVRVDLGLDQIDQSKKIRRLSCSGLHDQEITMASAHFRLTHASALEIRSVDEPSRADSLPCGRVDRISEGASGALVRHRLGLALVLEDLLDALSQEQGVPVREFEGRPENWCLGEIGGSVPHLE